MKIKNNKKAWIEIVEAFVAILLVAGVVLVILNKASLVNSDISPQVYTAELSMLREIETNDTFRAEIISISSVPYTFPSDLDIQKLIDRRTPNYLTCIGQVCSVDDKVCGYRENLQKDVYAQSVLISSTLRIVEYRQLKIFCWTKTNKCSDGTWYSTCSTTKPKYCNSNGNLVDNCSTCGCPTGQECKTISGAFGSVAYVCQQVSTCSDGTLYSTCSTTKPKYCDSNGNLVDNCNTCGCPTGQQCTTSSSPFGTSYNCQQIPTCSDGTLYSTCSTTKPKYCDSNGNLVDNCNTCGCPTGQTCSSGGASVSGGTCQ